MSNYHSFGIAIPMNRGIPLPQLPPRLSANPGTPSQPSDSSEDLELRTSTDFGKHESLYNAPPAVSLVLNQKGKDDVPTGSHSLESGAPELHSNGDSCPNGAAQLINSLSRRQSEVYHWICEGKRDREIAQILGISYRTVTVHVCAILSKLGVENRTSAAMMATRANQNSSDSTDESRN